MIEINQCNLLWKEHAVGSCSQFERDLDIDIRPNGQIRIKSLVT